MSPHPPDPATDAEMIRELYGFMLVQVAAAFVESGLARALDARSATVTDLAARTGCDEDATRRLLRALAAAGYCRRSAPDRYELTHRGERLARPDGVGELAVYLAGETYHAWRHLGTSLRTGTPAWAIDHEQPYFDWLAGNPEAGQRFDAAMAQTVASRIGPLVRRPWPEGGVVVDVGGGTGETLAAILEAHPTLQGVVVDVAPVAARALAQLQGRCLGARAGAVAADFFAPLPLSADTIVLSQILHDWPDDRAVAILRRCRDALRPGGCILVLDAVVGEDDTPIDLELLDLNMLVMLGGRERTLDEWTRLFADATVEICGVQTGPRATLMELRPAGGR